MPTKAQIEAAARAIYELDPFEEGGEYVEGFQVSPGGILSWEQAIARDDEFCDEPCMGKVTEFACKAAKAALEAAEAAAWEPTSEIERLRKANEIMRIGVNHIATYRTDNWPEVGTNHMVALEKLGAGREYDMWCCWDAAMRARNLMESCSPSGGSF